MTSETKHLDAAGFTAIHKVELEVKEYPYPTIFAGFRQVWIEGEVDGVALEVTSGAGLGSEWGTIKYGDRHFAFSARQLVEAFVEATKGGDDG